MIPWVRTRCFLDIRVIPDKNLLVGCLGVHCGDLKKAYSEGIFVGVEVGVFEVPVIDYQACSEPGQWLIVTGRDARQGSGTG
jgi:hypothetical protein